MAKIVEYMLVTASNDENLSFYVNERISAGWQPFGAPAISVAVAGGMGYLTGQVAQALIKYESKEHQQDNGVEHGRL